MKRAVYSFLLLATMTACGMVQKMCIKQATRELHITEMLIKKNEDDLNRGYAIEKVTVYENVWGSCALAPCMREIAKTEERPKAINVEETKEILAQLRIKRDSLEASSEAAVSECRIRYSQ